MEPQTGGDAKCTAQGMAQHVMLCSAMLTAAHECVQLPACLVDLRGALGSVAARQQRRPTQGQRGQGTLRARHMNR